MDSAELRQRLVAILAADVEGYSRLMSIDERATVASLDAARAVFRAHIEGTQGRVIDMAGDSVLAVFDTAIGAVSAAMAVHAEVNALADAAPAHQRMRFRIGVHLGDVIEKADGTVYGDGVNIAARLEGLAEAGGTTISEAVRGAVRGKLAATFEAQGEQRVKKIAEPVRAFRVRALGAVAPQSAMAAGARASTEVAEGAATHAGPALQGRVDDLRALGALCAASRCVSIAGPAGVGKTALAQALAKTLSVSAGRAMTSIDLVPLRDGALLAAAVGKPRAWPSAACHRRLPRSGRAQFRVACRHRPGSARCAARAVRGVPHRSGCGAGALAAAWRSAYLVTARALSARLVPPKGKGRLHAVR